MVVLRRALHGGADFGHLAASVIWALKMPVESRANERPTARRYGLDK